MEIVNSIDELRNALEIERAAGKSVGFVPTLGHLHEGHLALVKKSAAETDCTVVSIFVNPMQFGQNEDLDGYPRTLENDLSILEPHGVNYVFAPSVREMYPHGVNTQIVIPVLSNILCGSSRPGHFTGVATICTKLFNIVQPDVAVFGEKDYQQLTIIRHMVYDLRMPLKILGVPTARAPDGLALSSRNSYLTLEQREMAPTLNQCLTDARENILQGNNDYYQIEHDANQRLAASGFTPDYFKVLNHNLENPATVDQKLVILAAAQLGGARLIDNVQFER